MNRITTLFLLLCILLLSAVNGNDPLYAAQKRSGKTETKESISKRKQKNKKDIKETNKKIQTNAREVTRQLNELNLITAEIEECNGTVRGINGNISTLDKQINVLSDSVAILDNRLSTLSDKYAKAIRKMQTRNSAETSDFAFIFSAKSFAEAYYRSRSLKQFSLWRKKKADELGVMKSHLDQRKKALEGKKAERVVLLDSLNSQLSLLSGKKEQSDKLVEQLRREGSQLKNILAQQQKEADELDRELNRLIQLEQERIRKAEEERQRAEQLRKEKAEKERLQKEQAEKERREKETKEKQQAKPAPDKNKSKDKYNKPQKPEQQKPVKQETEAKTPAPVKTPAPKVDKPKTEPAPQITDFVKAKGRLPYPAKGKIVKKFGRQQHPDLKHVVTDNPGIDIETSPGAKVKSVFGGYVSDIFRLPGYNTIIMIRHGNYLTIYANLGSIAVKKGDQVIQGQEIGTVFVDPDDSSRSVLHFEVRNERSKEDPEQWIK